MDTPFTQRAANVLRIAEREARSQKHSLRGTEHLLLGLLAETEGLAARVLEHLDVTPAKVRARMEGKLFPGAHEPTGEIPFTPRTCAVLEHAGDEARRRGQAIIGTEHILLGLARENEGVAIRILEECGLDAARIRRQTERMLPPPQTTPWPMAAAWVGSSASSGLVEAAQTHRAGAPAVECRWAWLLDLAARAERQRG